MAASGPKIPADGLTLCLDAANRDSYPLTGSSWFNVVGTNSGSLINSPSFVTGSTNSTLTLSLNGTSQYVDLGNINAEIASGSSSLTITSWIRPNKFANYDGIVVRTGAVSPYGGWQLNLDSSGRLDFAINVSGSWQTYINKGGPTSALTSNTWYHVAGVYDGSTMKTYTNGSLVGSVSQTGSISYTSPLSNLYIGRNQSSYFGGNIATANVYNKALTASEISQEYNATRGRFDVPSAILGVVTSNLIMYYDFGDPASYSGSGTSVTDLSGNGLTATLVNSPTYVSSNGGYMNFSGTSYATVTNALIAPGTGDYSIDLWIQLPSASGYGHIYSIDSQGSYFFKHFNGGLYDGYAQANGGGGGTLPSGVWKHVAVTRTSGVCVFYVNAVQVFTRTITFNITPTNLRIRSDGGMGEWVQAYIAVPKFYKKGLTSTEVTQNFNVHRTRFGV